MNSNGTTNSPGASNSQPTYIMVLAVAAMVVMSVCLLALIVFLRCRICLIENIIPDDGRDANHQANREAGTRGIDEATLDSYPKMLYSEKGFRSSKSVEEPGDKGCCSICLGDYRESEMVRVMPDCGHMFHAICIDQWLRRHATCPFCRTSPHIPAAPVAELEPVLTIVSQP